MPSAARSTHAHAELADAASGLANPTRMKPAIVPIAIAIPPMVGVGALLHRSGRGGTTAPTTAAIRRTTAPIATAVAVAITKVRTVITTGVTESRIHKLRRVGGLVAKNEGPPAENAVPDCITSFGFDGG